MGQRSDELQVISSKGEHTTSKAVRATLSGAVIQIGEHTFDEETFRYADVRFAPNTTVKVILTSDGAKIRLGGQIILTLDNETMLNLVEALA